MARKTAIKDESHKQIVAKLVIEVTYDGETNPAQIIEHVQDLVDKANEIGGVDVANLRFIEAKDFSFV